MTQVSFMTSTSRDVCDFQSGEIMDNTLAYSQKLIQSLNTRFINSEIGLDDYRRSVKELLCSMNWQYRIQIDGLVFA